MVTVKGGRVSSDWWTPALDHFLERLGVPESNVHRNPFCG